MRSDVTTVMVSCRARHKARSLTTPQLQAVGIQPRVFLDHCTPLPERRNELGNKWIAKEALEWAEALGKPVLFLEDDIDLAPDFPRGVELAVKAGEVTYLYLNEIPNRMIDIYGPQVAQRLLDKEPTPLQAVRALTTGGLFGTQAVVIPHRLVRPLIDSTSRVRKAIDAALQRLLTDQRLPARVVVPNVAQHRHDRTGREPDFSVKRSISFDCPREVRDGVAT